MFYRTLNNVQIFHLKLMFLFPVKRTVGQNRVGITMETVIPCPLSISQEVCGRQTD